MKKITSILIVSLSLLMGVAFGQGKQLHLVCEGAYWGQVVVTWLELGQMKKYDSGKGIGNGYKHTIYLSESAKNIVAKVATDRGLGIYGDACTKSMGSSGGTFTFGGMIYSESCKFEPDEVGASNETIGVINVNEVLTGGNTHLHQAARSGAFTDAKSLISNGINLNAKNNVGNTALHEAIRANQSDIMDLLLKHGANPMEKNNQGHTPLYLAVNKGDKAMAAKIFGAGHNPHEAKKELERAILKRDLELVRVFLDHHVDPNQVCDAALKSNDIEVIQVALDEYGAKASIELFTKALDNRKYVLGKTLLEKGVNPNEALDQSISKRANALIIPCVEAGADANKALGFAVSSEDVEMASDALMLHQANADMYLETAVSKGSLPIVEAMLQSNADKNQALHYAIDGKNSQIIDLCLNYGAEVQDSHVEKLAKAGNSADLQKLIDMGGSTDVALAASMEVKQFTIARKMIEQGASPTQVVKIAVENQEMELLRTALSYQADPQPGLAPAIHGNHTSFAKALFEAGAQTQDPALVIASLDNGNSEILSWLIQSGTAVTNPAFIQKATTNKKLDQVQMLLNAGARPNDGLPTAININETRIASLFFEAGGKTNDPNLVHKALDNKNLEILRWMMKTGTNLKAPSFLEKSVNLKSHELVSLLLEAGANPNDGLGTAIKINDSRISGLLLSQGADASPAGYMATASQNQNIQIVNMLLQAGADPNPGMMPAVKANRLELVQHLLKAGADGSRDELMKASIPHNQTALTSLLLTAGANPQVGVEPAVHHNASSVLNLCLEQGAEGKDDKYLVYAVGKGLKATAKVLITHEANPLYTDAGDNNYLHISATAGHDHLISLLAREGVEVNVRNAQGESPLHLALNQGRKVDEMVKALIAVGADVNMPNAQGTLPLSFAKGRKVKSALKKAGARKK
ncbi:MAG: ankyrin repeat domain-containing protein [Bacteroidota bacterium]